MSSITTKKGAKAQQPNKSQRNRKRRIRKRAAKKAVNTLIKDEMRVTIEKCTREYASALVNPFGTRQTMPCIPDYISIPSNKFQTKLRGVFSTGIAGAGFVTLNPWLMAINNGGNSATQTSFAVTYTDVTYPNNFYTSAVAAGVFPAGVHGASPNSNFNDAFITTGNRQLRLVAAGLRISYTGSNFRNQGRVLLVKSQGNTSLPNNSTAANFLNDNYNSIVPISRKSEYVYYTPDSHDLMDYNNFNVYDPNVSGAAADRRSLVIYIDGGDTTTPQSWLFEAVAYFELVGSNLTLTKSDSDPEGLGNVLESLPVRTPTATPKVVEQTVFQRLLSLGTKKLIENAPTAMKVGGSLYNAYMQNQGGMSLITVEDID